MEQISRYVQNPIIFLCKFFFVTGNISPASIRWSRSINGIGRVEIWAQNTIIVRGNRLVVCDACVIFRIWRRSRSPTMYAR
jgi:hypothetical protein